MKKLRLGIIGTGIAAKKLHYPALKKLSSKIEITAVCNHTEKKAVEFSRMADGVDYHLDYRKLLKRDDVDAVDIVLPIDLNYKVTRDALEAGKHVFLEKPIAANMREAGKMLEFPRKFKRVMMVAENFRYRKVFIEAQKLIQDGKIGKPFALIWNVFYYITKENEYAQTKWRKNHKYPGGFMTDAGVHNAAAIKMLAGEIREGHAFTKVVNPDIGKPDNMSVSFSTSKNMNCVFNLFFSVNGKWEDRISVFGKNGTLEIEDDKIRLKREGKKDILKDCHDDHGYEAEFRDFYDAVVKKKKVKSDFRQAYNDLNYIISALKSAETGRKFRLD